MNRAFVTENDGWNYCSLRKRYCKDASLRGDCERFTCKYGPDEEKPEKEKEEK